MLALVSAPLRQDCAEAIAVERVWEMRPVAGVREAVAELTPEERRQVRAVVVEAEPLDGAVFGALPELELVACLRSEPVNVDVAAASERGIPVVHTPGRNAEAVADLALGVCLSCLRGIAESHHGIVSGALSGHASPAGHERAAGDVIWLPSDPSVPSPYVVYKGRQLSSLVVAVVGFGAVGRAVARRFSGLVREVLVVDPLVEPGEVVTAGHVPVTLAEALARADVVSLHARSAEQIVGREELAAMRPGGYLINTARATVLDYEALADALERGHLRAAALDVFPEEPLPASSRLLRVRGLTLTPHIAGATEEVKDRQSEIILAGVRGVYDPESDWRRLPVRNPAVRERWLLAHAEAARAGATSPPAPGEPVPATGEPGRPAGGRRAPAAQGEAS